MAAAEQELGRFKLLASAIAGRLVDVAATAPGEPAWTDGATVFVDPETTATDQLHAVLVQASLLGAGSLEPGVLAALARRTQLCRRYLAVEGHRALAAQEALLPTVARSLVDPRIADRVASPVASLQLAAGRDVLAEPPAAFGVIRPRQVHDGGDGERERQATGHVPRRSREQILPELDDADGDAAEPPPADVSSPVGGGGALGRLLKRLLTDSRSRESGPPGADSPTHRTGRSSRISRGAALSAATAIASDDASIQQRRGFTYPEWDVHRHAYRPDWCTVTESDVEVSTATPLALPGLHQLRRPLARVGLDVERRHRQPQGDDIDIDATVEAYVEVRAGAAPDDAIYIDNVRRRRDLSVLVLLDISGSAGQPSATGVAVHEHQRAAAAALTGALHDLGDRVALYAFRSMGRSAVHVVPVKRFDETFGPLPLRRLGGLVPGAYTRLGAAIRHGAKVLEDGGGTGRRLLVVLSDGFAYDHGYEGRYGEADARRALAEARRRGTGCLCLSIGAVTDADALRRVFGTAAHATVPRLEQLPGVVGPLFRAALRSAETQQRSWQRNERTRERLQVERRTA